MKKLLAWKIKIVALKVRGSCSFCESIGALQIALISRENGKKNLRNSVDHVESHLDAAVGVV